MILKFAVNVSAFLDAQVANSVSVPVLQTRSRLLRMNEHKVRVWGLAQSWKGSAYIQTYHATY